MDALAKGKAIFVVMVLLWNDEFGGVIAALITWGAGPRLDSHYDACGGAG